MVDAELDWKPGSFTKNYSWGDRSNGLVALHRDIRVGFAGRMEDVPREEFRDRVEKSGHSVYVAINFFLFNKIREGKSYLVADELVFQALSYDHSPRFDKLALFAFNFSFAGTWIGANPDQRRPALWAHYYIRDRVARDFGWDANRINADDIEKFLRNDKRYVGKTTRKVATNLSYLYLQGGLTGSPEKHVERWWVDALFLALDRLIEDRESNRLSTSESEYSAILSESGFRAIGGKPSYEKDLAAVHLILLYNVCGSRARFSDEYVQAQTTLRIPDVAWLLANDARPQGAVHPTNPRILKTIPRSCAMLARYAGFEIIDADELTNFNLEEFVRRHTRNAIDRLQDNGVRPIMSSDELMKLTRGR